MTDPTVSVIIPTYNWSSVLRYAIQSVLWQTFQDFELLLVGDGCTDDSAEVAASFGDARIRWHNLPRNSGNQSAPNNFGIEQARGRYIAYLGHDDLWYPNHLERMVGACEELHADFACSIVVMIGPPPSGVRVVKGAVGPLEPGTLAPPSGTMHLRAVVAKIGGWKDYRTVWRNPDTDFVYRAMEAGFHFVSTRELTVYKFNSSLRKNSYIEKPFHEQAAYHRRIENDRWFLTEEILEIMRVHLRRLPMQTPVRQPPPQPHTPGWEVAQYRRFRGLE